MEHTSQFLEDVLNIYAMFVQMFFSFEILPGISIGYLIVAVGVLGVIVFYLIGRLK